MLDPVFLNRAQLLANEIERLREQLDDLCEPMAKQLVEQIQKADSKEELKALQAALQQIPSPFHRSELNVVWRLRLFELHFYRDFS